jgi:hypothetical protein
MQRFLFYLFLKTLYMFQAVPSPIIKSAQLYIELMHYETIPLLAATFDEMELISSTVAACSSIV